jgi:PPM family protein phosphatase
LEDARLAMLRQAELESVSSLRTTLVVLLTDMKDYLWAHVGDSRLYFFKCGIIKQYTADHSVPQQLAAGGLINADEIRFHEDRNRLTAVFDGTEIDKVTVSVLQGEVEQGDAFLLCTDGFWECVTEEMMEKYLSNSQTAKDWLEEMEQAVISTSEKGSDNYSAIAILVK